MIAPAAPWPQRRELSRCAGRSRTGSSVTRTRPGVRRRTWSAALQLWVMPIANTFLYGDAVMLRTAPALDGPWAAAAPLYSYPPALRASGAFCYAAKAHEELLADPLAHEFVFSFNCNTDGLGPLANQPDVYIPQLVRVTWA